MPVLPQEEQTKQHTWFTKVHAHNESFIEKVTKWLSVTEQADLAQDHAEPSLAGIAQHENAPANGNATSDVHVSECNKNAGYPDTMETSAIQLVDVKPSDSVSNISNRSNTSKRSNTSSTHSARIKAEAEMAALMAHQKLLQDKHALEEEEELLRKRKEKLALEMDIAASAAKWKVLGLSDSCPFDVSGSKTNGMNSYLERERKKS